MKSITKSKSAFTLIEVLIASFISAIALGTACTLFFQSSRILNASHSRIDALQKARTAMEYLKSQKFDSTVMNFGSHKMTLNGIPFKYTVTKSSIDDKNIKDVTVQVDWQSSASGQTRQVELISMVSSPLHQSTSVTLPPSVTIPDDDDDYTPDNDGDEKKNNNSKSKNNNGHGNNEDGVDSSNPGKSKEDEDSDPNVDDEKGYSDNDRVEEELDQFTNGDKKKKDKKKKKKKKND
jgi:prepilin-type N-terminal cleavage/methylation domain-containing protein